MPHDREVMGSIPVAAWFFFARQLLLSSQDLRINNGNSIQRHWIVLYLIQRQVQNPDDDERRLGGERRQQRRQHRQRRADDADHFHQMIRRKSEETGEV